MFRRGVSIPRALLLVGVALFVTASLVRDAGAAVPGDADQDGDVDLADFLAFQRCFSGPGLPLPDACEPFDGDTDGDVDLADLLRFQSVFTGSLPPNGTDRPNVLFIVVDDLNDWVGYLGGHPGTHTPNIDRLASQGMYFTRAFCAAPLCKPSRVSVLTGIHPSTSQVYGNAVDWRTQLPDAVTLPRYFRDHGYHVAGGGKIFHGRFDDETAWDAPAWDEYFQEPWWQFPEPAVRPANGIESGAGIGPNFDWAAMDEADDAYADTRVARWAGEFLSRPHDKPFFLAIGLFLPHLPWFVPQKYFDLHPRAEIVLPTVIENDLDDIPPIGVDRALPDVHHARVLATDNWENGVQAYLAAISFADARVGQILDALDASPHANNTIIVLWSDHGYHLGEKQHWEKLTPWDEAARVPLIVSGAARLWSPPSRVDTRPAPALPSASHEKGTRCSNPG